MRFRRGRRCLTAVRRRTSTGLRRSLVWRREFRAWLSNMLTSRTLAETPKPGDGIFARSRWVVLLDSGTLEAAAAARARELGWHVEIDNRCDDWSAERAATYLLDRVRELRQEHERVCLLSAGEVTVQVPSGSTGRGGRNQHFALLCSECIAGEEITVLSAGSDGIDGNSPAAGALVDGSTAARAANTGHRVDRGACGVRLVLAACLVGRHDYDRADGEQPARPADTACALGLVQYQPGQGR